MQKARPQTKKMEKNTMEQAAFQGLNYRVALVRVAMMNDER